MAIPSTGGRRIYQNPLRVFLNEASTFYQNGVSQFIELFRYLFRDDATMQGYSIIVAETTHDQKNTKGDMYVKSAFQLETATFRAGQQYGTIGRSKNEAEIDDLFPWKPSHLTLRVPSSTMTTSYDFLSVADFQIEVIFLMYSENQTLFDADVWPYPYRSGRKFRLTGSVLDYVVKNSIDAMVISGLGAPYMIDEVRNIFCKLFDFDFEPFAMPYAPACVEVVPVVTSASVGLPLSISKCGPHQDLPFLMKTFKHGARM